MSPDIGYEFIEYFSGKARLAQMAAAAGFVADAYDKTYGDSRAAARGKRSCMDINSNAGLTLPV